MQITVDASDVDDSTLSLITDTPPSNGVVGTVSVNPGPQFVFSYTPDDMFFGTDVFTVVVLDGSSSSDPFTITVTVNNVNDQPVLDPQSFSVDEDTPTVLPVVVNDPDSSSWTFTLVDGPSEGTFDATSLTYSPPLDYSGTTSVTLTADDGSGIPSNEGVMTITVNGMPCWWRWRLMYDSTLIRWSFCVFRGWAIRRSTARSLFLCLLACLSALNPHSVCQRSTTIRWHLMTLAWWTRTPL